MSEAGDKHIGRRAFIALVAAGVAALFLGPGLFTRRFSGGAGSAATAGFRINTVAPGALFEEDNWRLTVDGLVRRPREFTFSQFKALPQSTFTDDFRCVEGWGVDDVTWRGVTVREILKVTDIDPVATHLVFYSSDGIYTDSLTLEEALRPDTLLAHEVNGEFLPQEMGRPLRVIIPGSYGYKNVKWVVRVEAIAAGPDGYRGYWEQRGYPADATI